MKNLFLPDSKLFTILDRLGDLLILNFIFLICCIPVVTIGAACTAMYTVCFQFSRGEEPGVVKLFFRAFWENLKQATLIWVLMLVFLVASAVDAVVFYRLEGAVRYVFPFFATAAAVLLMASQMVFPLMSQFRNSWKGTLKNAFLLAVGKLPIALGITVIWLLPFLIGWFDPVLFFKIGFLWVTVYFALAARIGCFMLKKTYSALTEKSS